MDNDALRHEMVDALALLQEQMADLAVLEQQLATLSVSASAADGTVVVSVDAHGIITGTAVHESYLDDHDFADLGGHVTAAAQAATAEAGERMQEMFGPLERRRERMPSLADIVPGAPDIRDVLGRPSTSERPIDDERGSEETGYYPTVRS